MTHFQMEDELDEEEITCGLEDRTCDICDKTFANEGELKRHLPEHQLQQETLTCESGKEVQGHSVDLQSFNDLLSPMCLPPKQQPQNSPDFQSLTAASDNTNLSSPSTGFNKSIQLDLNNDIVKGKKTSKLKNNEERCGSSNFKEEEIQLENIKDEALWDILEVKMEPEEENAEEYKRKIIPKQKYNKLKKFEGKLFRWKSKAK